MTIHPAGSLSSDKYPREIEGLEERLKSRFVWGLTVEIEPPELETRVAILLKKAEAEKVELDTPVAFFIAERIRSNVRELEGALRRVIANARFTGSKITIEQVKRALRDLFAIQDRQISIDNIQKTVALYFNIKIADMVSKRRNRTVARPRQMAMALAKVAQVEAKAEPKEAMKVAARAQARAAVAVAVAMALEKLAMVEGKAECMEVLRAVAAHMVEVRMAMAKQAMMRIMTAIISKVILRMAVMKTTVRWMPPMFHLDPNDGAN